VSWINQKWGDSITGLWYPVIFLGLAAIMAIWFLPETSKENLAK
jgi:hypothetical protein